MSEATEVDIAIIGAGPAGYTAAIYASRAGYKTVVASGLQAGGQLTVTTDVENYPGFAQVVQGPWLMEQMRQQVENVGAEIIAETITSINLSKRPFLARADSGRTFRAKAVIVATGATARWLGLASETRFRGFGVSACATCDGFFFKDKVVAVVGGGNTAVEEALYLTNHASKVYLIHRRDSLRAEAILQDRLFAHPAIEVIWSTEVFDIDGSTVPFPAMTGLRVRNVRSGVCASLAVEGLFVAIGHTPATDILAGQVELDREGYIAVTPPNGVRTSVPGLFAAGDVADKTYRQAVYAAGMGCAAALEAAYFIASAG
ncbi:thioredoxin-disulfide reductase [Mesorhizobium sp.]|uniref:thioredoxin-disulfide reductase n=1 Tax=Mesorhizobium sp. TaxID=1871066 RepID=UPI000FE8AACD|nr:thioredoxin-disulfide reductase [Mesorhizobium sp.]RWM45457.1 MAG: thioredoxin-disulfide reductase [Mesorhizobium sp.]RWM58223.1 MAG: thioredoxin-disulfide reductase [Mesorhizobium sp.]RWM58612.1 MAG: thioredoxin-disulfide reductase [Mesorhizobium sp.]TIO70089.1 MAG: thioredoxin-disulfide reductase [Mesorhizobium sp.]TJV93981.1 MAG: thioredoxin-disulfide reductase [Mesorhizobium sp.]